MVAQGVGKLFSGLVSGGRVGLNDKIEGTGFEPALVNAALDACGVEILGEFLCHPSSAFCVRGSRSAAVKSRETGRSVCHAGYVILATFSES